MTLAQQVEGISVSACRSKSRSERVAAVSFYGGTTMAGQLINRGDNIWYVRIFLGRDTATGKRKFHNKTIHGTKKEAQRYLNGVLRELDLGIYVEPCALTVNEYLDSWLSSAAKPKLRERTFEEYEALLRRYVRAPFGARKLVTLRPLDIQALYSQMLDRKLSPRSVRYTHAVLSSALKQAVQWGMLARNPCEGVELPKKTRREMQVLTPEQARAFLQAAADDRYATLFSLAIATGMRPEEYFALKWSDLNWQAHTATVQRALIKRRGGGWYFEEPKTSQSRRSVKLPLSLVRQLQEHRHRQLEERLRLGAMWQNHELVFCSEIGTPLNDRNISQRHFKRILTRAGLPESCTLYTLRHTAATLLLVAGVNPKIVAEQLGHASITHTLDVYSHVLPEMQTLAAEKMEAALFG